MCNLTGILKTLKCHRRNCAINVECRDEAKVNMRKVAREKRSRREDRRKLPRYCKWRVFFSRRGSICRCSPVPGGRIPSRSTWGRRRRSCCRVLRDPIRPIRRAPRPVERLCPRTSCECTTRSACNAQRSLHYLCVSRLRRMQYVSRATLRSRVSREYQFPARRVARARARAKFPDTSIYFPGAIKSTSAARERAEGDEIYIREKRRARGRRVV